VRRFLLLVCLLGAFAGPQAAAGWLDHVGLEQRIGAFVPVDAVVTEEAGRSLQLRELLAGRPAILVLAYYACRNVCGTLLGELAARLRDLDLRAGRDFDVLVVSIDPREGPNAARARKAQYAADAAAWHFLTADARTIAALAATAGMRFERERDADGFVHPAAMLVLTPAGRISSYLFALEPDGAALRYGLIAASEHRLGTPSDRLWLLCHRFDPATGRYTSLVAGLERGLSLVSVALLAACIAWAARRGRKDA
jgi:protein SCO1/2